MAALWIFLAFNWKEGAIVEKLEEKKLGNYARAPASLRPSRRREEDRWGSALSLVLPGGVPPEGDEPTGHKDESQ